MKLLLTILLCFCFNALADCPPSPPPPTTSCTGKANQVWTNPTNNQTSVASSGLPWSIQLPIAAVAGKVRMFNGINSPIPGVVGLRAEYSVSTCPGDFLNNPLKCRTVGQPENGAIVLNTKTGTVDGPSCTMLVGQQYYLNIRYLNCPAGGTCSSIVFLHGN